MLKRTKTLFAALGALVLLVGGYFGLMIRENMKKASEAPPSYSPPAELGNLESTELVRIEGSGITLERDSGIWELSYLEGGIPPGGIPLDQSQIIFLSFSLATVWVESVVDEEPGDLSEYGLKNPSSRTVVTDSAGRKAEYILGDMTPSRSSYYVMEIGNPAVYTISVHTAKYMQFFLDGIRQRYIFPTFEIPSLLKLSIESAETKIEIGQKEISLTPHLAAPFATHVITSPYKFPRGVYNEALNSLIAPFKNLAIADFIDDNPSSLAQYGLDKPVRVFLQTQDASIDLLIGNTVNGKRYAKSNTAGNAQSVAPGVFTLNNMEGVINTKPFNLIDNFVLLVNIDWVDHLSISGGEKNYNADLQGSGNEAAYFLNGKKAETDSFRMFYQSVIGLLADSEYTTTAARQSGESGEITIEFRLNTPPGEQASLTLLPHNRDFYALRQEGATEFLISRNQIRKIFEAAEAVVYQ